MPAPIDQVRYSGDLTLLAALRDQFGEDLSRVSGHAAAHRTSVRKRLLAHAVRVDPRMLPKLADSIATVQERAQVDQSIEAYVFDDRSINAFLTRGQRHSYLGLSSGAVDVLDERELEFVIGHELGHALFEHLDVAPVHQLQNVELQVRSKQQLLAWMRASEISADRVGLVCCGSIDVAATAMYRSLSGLRLPGLSVHPEDFSEQWDHLLAEVIEHGDGELWQATHPFPPMRMKAMTLFWESDTDTLPGARATKGVPLAEVDDQIGRLLATIDPSGREQRGGTDPLIEDIVVCAGRVIAHASGQLEDELARRMRERHRDSMIQPGVATASSYDGCLRDLEAAIRTRSRRLKPLEVHRVLASIVSLVDDPARFDAGAGDSCWRAFCDVAKMLGVDERGSRVVLERQGIHP